jgi:hypothetical protein
LPIRAIRIIRRFPLRFSRALPALGVLAVLGATSARPAVAAPARPLAPISALTRIATVASVDERFGVPTFVWATRDPFAPSAASAPSVTAEGAARAELARLVPFYGLGDPDLASARLRHVHDTGEGGIIATYRQTIDGVDVFGEELKILLGRDLRLVAASGFLTPSSAAPAAPAERTFALPPEDAEARARLEFGSAELTDPPSVKRVFFHTERGLEPAYYVELAAADAGRSFVVSARDGRVLFSNDLTAHAAYSYRVWADGTTPYMPLDGPQGSMPTPHPTGTPVAWDPGFVAPRLISLQSASVATGDPWLPDGATATTGNNVDAYADLVGPDGWSPGDLRPTLTSASTFDRTYDTALPPGVSPNQTMAAVTQLFYTTNWLHDWFYDAGFDELSGNAQTNNYGRGGVQGDPLRAEGQDYVMTNNATTYTPADGGRPKIQMFVFNPLPVASLVVDAPASIAGPKPIGRCSFAPVSFTVTGTVVEAADAVPPTSDACGPLSASAAGRIVLIDRSSSCSYTTQIVNAQNAGAIGAILVATDDAPPPTLGGTPSTPITIAVFSVMHGDGEAIRAQIPSGVTLTMTSVPHLQRDGTIDNQTVVHEWGHYMSNRLIGDANGLTTNQARGLGEGWSDFTALLVTARREDASVPANTAFSGAYSFGGYPMCPSIAPSTTYYYGLRRYPYSTDVAKDPLTFRHMQNGVPLPVGPPVAFGSSGGYNSEIHATGEVWCTMLWECYVALLNDVSRLTFRQAQARMRNLLVASYKMTPLNPTLTEARDALLAVAYAEDPADHALFCEAFARRGAGIGAVSPPRDSPDNAGVVESHACGGALALVSASLEDDLVSCDDDGALDRGETGMLRIALSNVGSAVLSSITATVTSANPYVAFPAGNVVPLPAAAPFATTEATIPVMLTGAAGIQDVVLSIAYGDPEAVPQASAGPFALVLRANVDPAPSAHETFETASGVWSTTGSVPAASPQAWRRAQIDGEWRATAPEATSPADQTFVTPPLFVLPGASLTLTYRQRHAFDSAGTQFRDGGVIELSDDAGAHWQDVGLLVPGGYGGSIYNFSGNPLAGRPAFVGRSAGWPAMQPVTLALGTSYGGRTVQLRFRMGSDAVGTGGSWDIDDLAFDGISNLPFVELVSESDPCASVSAGESGTGEVALAIVGAHPARGELALRFDLPRASRVTLELFDAAGRRVATLADGDYATGSHLARWGAGARAGVYFARLAVDGAVRTRRAVLVTAARP